ncbi:MAG TPA: coiled-coil domain-containing protein [Stellaceae bacterium]|nr:coiled-coil domain-containing protein [Stellaceae bacterium]
MAEVPFDTLKLARRLEAAGFPTQQAGDVAEAIAEAISQLATKTDLAALQAATRADIAALRAELKVEMAALRTELRAEIELLKRDITIRLGSMIVVATGVLLAAKYFG